MADYTYENRCLSDSWHSHTTWQSERPDERHPGAKQSIYSTASTHSIPSDGAAERPSYSRSSIDSSWTGSSLPSTFSVASHDVGRPHIPWNDLQNPNPIRSSNSLSRLPTWSLCHLSLRFFSTSSWLLTCCFQITLIALPFLQLPYRLKLLSMTHLLIHLTWTNRTLTDPVMEKTSHFPLNQSIPNPIHRQLGAVHLFNNFQFLQSPLRKASLSYPTIWISILDWLTNTDFCGKPCRMYLHPRKLTQSCII